MRKRRENQHVAEELGVSPNMVGKWRKRFVATRLDGLWMSLALDAPARLPMTTLNASSTRRCTRSPGAARNGVAASWRLTWTSPTVLFVESGVLSGCAPIGRSRSRCRRTRSSSRKCEMSQGSTWRHRTTRWSCASTRSRRFRLSTDRNRFCRWCPHIPSGAHLRTSGTAPRRSSLRWTVASGLVIGKTYRRHRAIEFRKFPRRDRPVSA